MSRPKTLEYDHGNGTTFLGLIHIVLLTFRQMEPVPRGSVLRFGVDYPVPPTPNTCQGFKIRLWKDTHCTVWFRATAEHNTTFWKHGLEAIIIYEDRIQKREGESEGVHSYFLVNWWCWESVSRDFKNIGMSIRGTAIDCLYHVPANDDYFLTAGSL